MAITVTQLPATTQTSIASHVAPSETSPEGGLPTVATTALRAVLLASVALLTTGLRNAAEAWLASIELTYLGTDADMPSAAWFHQTTDPL